MTEIGNKELYQLALAHFNEPVIYAFNIGRLVGYAETAIDCYWIIKDHKGKKIWHTCVGGVHWLDRLMDQHYVKSSGGEDWDDFYRLDSGLKYNGCDKEEAFLLEIHNDDNEEWPTIIDTLITHLPDEEVPELILEFQQWIDKNCCGPDWVANRTIHQKILAVLVKYHKEVEEKREINSSLFNEILRCQKFIRKFEDEKKILAKAALNNEGNDKPCYYCGEPCNIFAGNPGLWPISFCHTSEPGVVKWHHAGCVSERLDGIRQR